PCGAWGSVSSGTPWGWWPPSDGCSMSLCPSWPPCAFSVCDVDGAASSCASVEQPPSATKPPRTAAAVSAVIFLFISKFLSDEAVIAEVVSAAGAGDSALQRCDRGARNQRSGSLFRRRRRIGRG